MRQNQSQLGNPHEPEGCPAAWFAVLEHARENNDFERAAQAIRELRRLGVHVKYPVHPRRHKRGGGR